MALIHLHEFDGVALIVKTPSGVRYTNQAGGYACSHPELEGVLVPVPLKVGRPEVDALQQHFHGSWHALQPNDADVIDGVLWRYDLGFLSVDRDLLDQSYEAWVHVRIDPAGARELFDAPDWRSAVLTWQNSD